MFNITVLKMKDIVKYSFEILITILIIFCITKYFFNSNTKSNLIPKKLEYNLTGFIDTTIPIAKEINDSDSETKQDKKTNFFEKILESQIGSIDDLDTFQSNEDDINKEEKNVSDNIEVASGVENTEVITNNPIATNYNVEYGKVKIKNQTSYNLTQEMLTPDITIDNKNIVLFSTHTCESYTSSEKFSYTPTGTFRTTDLNFTVARVADELDIYLNKYNYNVIHDKTYHDYPAYNGSYTRSLETVENILSNNKTDIIFDVHRDAIGSRSDYAPIVKIGDNDIAAQIMFVIGTNERRTLASKLESKFKVCSKNSGKGRRNVPRFI